jgi:hypothetical protein
LGEAALYGKAVREGKPFAIYFLKIMGRQAANEAFDLI